MILSYSSHNNQLGFTLCKFKLKNGELCGKIISLYLSSNNGKLNIYTHEDKAYYNYYPVYIEKQTGNIIVDKDINNMVYC